MQKKDTVLTRHLTIVNELGLHARSASKIAAIAQKATSRIWIASTLEKADATSILDILTLACAKGSRITISIENPEDDKYLTEICDLINNGFGE